MLVVRLAEPCDALAVARVHVRSWQAAYRGHMPDTFLDSLRPEDRVTRYDFATRDPNLPRTVVAELDGFIAGFAATAPSRDTDLAGQGYGELCGLYLDPDYWGRGFGKILISSARARLAGELGFGHACLWVLDGNARAERFYQLDGWRRDGARKTEAVWGAVVEEVRYRRELQVTPSQMR